MEQLHKDISKMEKELCPFGTKNFSMQIYGKENQLCFVRKLFSINCL